MPDTHNKQRQGIESLLVERKKYEAWLAQLEIRRESTAEHVFARVHADYSKRLEDVRQRLGAEADGIQSLVSDLDERLATEQRLVTEKSDERAELELRATVGEFSEKEWTATRAKLDRAIDELRGKFEATERELVEMREIVRSVMAPAAPVPESAAASLREPTPRVSASVTAAPSMPRARTPFDELAFLKSVAGTPATAPPMAPVGETAVEAPPVAAAAPALEIALEIAPETAPETALEPVVEAEGRLADDVAVAAAVARAPEDVYDMAPAPSFAAEPEVEEESDPPRGRASSRTSVEMSALGAPTPRTSEAIRSLKCQECGTLNFPTEWYCEKCGGELAAF